MEATQVNFDEMTPEQIEQYVKEGVGAMRDEERGKTYRIAKVSATINTDRWWLQLQGQDEAFDKRDYLEGQIVGGIILRNLYRKGMDFPLCSSTDGGVTGSKNPDTLNVEIGIPDGQGCASCPWNQFRSANLWQPAEDGKEGKGKACKERRALLMLVPGFEQPIIVRISTSSIGIWDAYAQALDLVGDSYIRHLTRITAKQVTEGGYTYGVAVFSDAGKIENRQVAMALASKRTQYIPLLTAQAAVEQIKPMDNFSQPAATQSAPPPPPEEGWEDHLPHEQGAQPF